MRAASTAQIFWFENFVPRKTQIKVGELLPAWAVGENGDNVLSKNFSIICMKIFSGRK